jgi:hypothetical protein
MMFRTIWLLLCAGGGIYAGFILMQKAAHHVSPGAKLHLTPEVVPMLLPVGIVGALVGLLLGGILLPQRR